MSPPTNLISRSKHGSNEIFGVVAPGTCMSKVSEYIASHKSLLTRERYYAHDPESRRLPIFLVPTRQFQDFLAEANSDLDTHLSIPTGNHGDRFKVRFKGVLQPQSLGCIRNAEEFEQQKHYLLPLIKEDFDAETLQLFNQKIENIYLSFKPSKKKPETKYWNQLARRKSWSRAIKRVQRYLGLRQRVTQEILNGMYL
jgi:hypothetical protein